MDSSSLANFSELRQKLNNWGIDAEDLVTFHYIMIAFKKSQSIH